MPRIPMGWAAGCLLSIVPATLSCAARLDVDGARAHARVVHQVEAGPRIPGTPGHQAIRTWIESEITRLGGTVEVHAFVDTSLGRPLALSNVIGHFGPQGGRRVALCAHWDTRPWGDRDPDPAKRDQPILGANDAGSGVAVLFEVAELMHRSPPPIGVDLVFLDGEDQAEANQSELFCLGSREYARRLRPTRDTRSPITAAFVFDMIGDKDLAIHPEVESSRRAANLVDVVLQAARATGAKHFHADPKWSVYDDHMPLLEAGIPAVDIIDFDYAAWHTSHDLPDQVSAASLAEVAGVAAWIVYRSDLARP